jgi:hypothetical protein
MIYNLRLRRRIVVFTSSLREKRGKSFPHHPASHRVTQGPFYQQEITLFSSFYNSSNFSYFLIFFTPFRSLKSKWRQWRFICENTYPIDRLMLSRYPFLYQLNLVSDEPYAVHIKAKLSLSRSGSFCSDSRDCKKCYEIVLINLQKSLKLIYVIYCVLINVKHFPAQSD